MSSREAFLLPEYAPWYPRIRAGVWLSAEMVAHAVGSQLSHGEPRWVAGPRILSDHHFRFRGGSQARSSALRTRRSERSTQWPRLW